MQKPGKLLLRVKLAEHVSVIRGASRSGKSINVSMISNRSMSHGLLIPGTRSACWPPARLAACKVSLNSSQGSRFWSPSHERHQAQTRGPGEPSYSRVGSKAI